MLLLSPNPAAPPPYEQRFVFTLDFSEPGSVLPEADRLTHLFLPSTEFPTWMLSLSSAPTTLSLAVNLAKSVILDAYLAPTDVWSVSGPGRVHARSGPSLANPLASALIYR